MLLVRFAGCAGLSGLLACVLSRLLLSVTESVSLLLAVLSLTCPLMNGPPVSGWRRDVGFAASAFVEIEIEKLYLLCLRLH